MPYMIKKLCLSKNLLFQISAGEFKYYFKLSKKKYIVHWRINCFENRLTIDLFAFCQMRIRLKSGII